MSNWEQFRPLAPLTTFGVPASARWYVEAHDDATAIEALQEADARQLPVLVLGGGSNMLFTRDYPGLVVRMAQRGIQLAARDDGTARVDAAAGEPWHGLVMHTLQQGLSGLENLALIPGTAGAAPVQNIGAYGTELKDVLEQVRVWDRQQRCERLLSRDDCQFGYRDSLFKREPGRYLILQLGLVLSRTAHVELRYADIRQELQARGIGQPTPQDVCDAVIAIRSRKLPDPAVWGNAGSFFKNPVLPAAEAAALLQAFPAAPHWPQADGSVKVAAGWLIEQCGWKGRSVGQAGVYERQALVLVNRGGATGAEIRELARQVAQSVAERFAVRLEPEPLIL